ncbi:MAG TPA: hypothetical protein VGZ22_16880, partial [Isosphaeraceae bacterium]|nr:hypothetical protein [Isosphaeraceae bacterium]
PLASLLETEGGPFLYEDQRLGGRVFVAAVPQVRRIGVDAGRPRHAEAEPHLSWPSSNPPSSRC